MPAFFFRRVLLGASFSARNLFPIIAFLTLLWLAPASLAQAGGASALHASAAASNLPPQPGPMLVSVSVNPTSVIGGSSATGMVTVSSTGAGLAHILLSSSSSVVQVPSGVSLSAATGTMTFPITTTAVSSATPVTITAFQQYATGNGNRDIITTATLTVNPAFTVPAYLANLTLSSITVTGGNSATGTVALSSPAPANITVTLHSNNSAATVPITCTILANTAQATFSITTTAVSANTDVTLSGSYNGWTQGSELSLLPSNPPSVPPPGTPVIRVAPGNGCAVVSWTRLAAGTVSGYNVYRTSGGTTTRLTSTPFPSNFYPDTGLTNDTTTYTYQVSAVDMQGHEQALSAPVSATPSSVTATLNWNNAPSAVTGNTGNTILSLSWSSGVPSFGTLLFVDGVQAGSAGSTASYVNGVQTYTVSGGFDFSKLSNGPHVVQYLGFADANETITGVTSPITIQVNNTISSFHIVDTGFDPTQGELCYLSATVPAGSTWTVQVTSQDGSTVFRTWQGASSSVNLAWDGNDASGKLLPLTDYALALTVQPPGTSPSATGAQAAPNATGTATKKHPVSPQHGQPVALALISIGASYYLDSNNNITATPAQDIQLAGVLTTAYTTLYGANNFKVIRSDTFDPFVVVGKDAHGNPLTALQQLEGWLGTAQVFYLFGHGAGAAGTPGASQTPRSTAWNGVGTSYINNIELFPSATVAFSPSDFNILVPNYVGSSHHVFAWVDSCNSAGGNSVTGEIGTADYIWARAFNNADTFIGNNGFGIVNNANALNSTGVSAWYNWRQIFWGKLAVGQTILQAYQNCWSPSGAVNTSTYYSRYFVNSTQTFYDCTPGDGYGGNPRVVFYGDPFGTSLML